MRFIADAMLGRLARWLRLLGFDTYYVPDIDDAELLRQARKEGRFILTRDSHFRRKDITDCLFIESDDVMEQVEQVLGELRLSPPPGGRCANCNGLLEEVPDKDAVREAVPEYVFHAHNRFERCTRCGNVYWEGTQYRRIREIMEKITGEGGGK